MTVSDGTASASQSFDWLLVPVVLTNPGDQASVGQSSINLALSATVASGYTAAFSATGLPTGLSIDSGTGIISGTLDSGDTGSAYLVSVSATAGGVTSTQEFLWRVGTVVAAPAEQTSVEGDSVSLQVSAAALSGTLSYSAIGLPDGLSINASTGVIAGTIAAGAAADGPDYTATVIVSNGTVADARSFNWIVNPRIEVDAVGYQVNVEGDTVSLSVTASEPGATLTYSAINLPTGLSIDSQTGQISGTVANDAAGWFGTVVTVSDGTYSAKAWFGWTIKHANNSAPVFDDPGLQSNVVGDNVYLALSAADAEGDTLEYSAEGLPDGLFIDYDTGVISGTLTESALRAAPYAISVTADDGNGGVSTETFSWIVNDSALSVQAQSLSSTAGSDTNVVTVATFTNSDPRWVMYEFAATIHWGDGTSDAGAIEGSNGSFVVKGIHVYQTAGIYDVQVDVSNGFHSVSDVGSASVSEAAISVTGGVVFSAAVDSQVSGVVAKFTGNRSLADESFTATIDWGDGSTTEGVVTGFGGDFVVSGSHTYESKGDYTITVSVSDPDGATASNTSTAHVYDFVAGIESTLTIEAFRSIDPYATLADFEATIDWGDGTSSNSSAEPDEVWITSGAGGVYMVHGKHAYANDSAGQAGGVYDIGVEVDGPYGESITAESHVAVGRAPLTGFGASVRAEPETAFENRVVAMFYNPAFSDSASSFVATIFWGDGTSSVGTISGQNGWFSVLGSHEYLAIGCYAARIEVTESVAAPGLRQVFDAVNFVMAVPEPDTTPPLVKEIIGTPSKAQIERAIKGSTLQEKAKTLPDEVFVGIYGVKITHTRTRVGNATLETTKAQAKKSVYIYGVRKDDAGTLIHNGGYQTAIRGLENMAKEQGAPVRKKPDGTVWATLQDGTLIQVSPLDKFRDTGALTVTSP